MAKPEIYANINRPFGLGIVRPSSRAVSIHSSMITSAFFNASSCVAPSTMHPGSSGTSARNAASSSLQYKMISYFVFIRPLPAYTAPTPPALAEPDMVSLWFCVAGDSKSQLHPLSHKYDDRLSSVGEIPAVQGTEHRSEKAMFSSERPPSIVAIVFSNFPIAISSISSERHADPCLQFILGHGVAPWG